MPRDRKSRRATLRFRPTVDGASHLLESRVVLSNLAPALRANAAFGRKHGPPLVFRKGLTNEGIPQSPRKYVQVGVANGGAAAPIIDVDGEFYVAHVTGGGTVRAKAAPNGRVDLTLFGTRVESVLTIDPTSLNPAPNSAHIFATGTGIQDGVLHIRNITVVNGKVGQLLGYRTAEISGAITVQDTRQSNPRVNRIAFYALKPGASIRVPGDLNTLDIFNSIELDGGPGIRVGRDLNWFNMNGSLTLVNGAAIIVGRDIGLTAQEPKGTGPGGQGGFIRGDLIVGTGSTIAVGRAVDAPIIVQGSSLGIANLPLNVQAATIVVGTRG